MPLRVYLDTSVFGADLDTESAGGWPLIGIVAPTELLEEGQGDG